MVEVIVAGLALDASTHSPIVLLRDPSGHRQVPIWITHEQAHNIASGYKQAQAAPPLSHDLMVSLLIAGGLHLDRVIIHSIEESSFKALLKIQLQKATNPKPNKITNNLIEIEARPSDAISLAIRTKCTIWMLEKVFSEASIPVNEEADAEEQHQFRKFLKDLSPADLIRHLTGSDQIDDDPSNSNESDPKTK